MKLTKQIKKAQILAYKTHLNQVDKSGVPYIYHPIHIAQQMDTETEYIVALLHDVIKDSEQLYNQAFILQEPIPELSTFSRNVKDALIAITRKKNEPYMEYIQRVKENPIATKVKIADLKHNMDLSRLPFVLTDKDRKRLKKYTSAYWFLINLPSAVFQVLGNVLLFDANIPNISYGYAEDRVCVEEENGVWSVYIGSKGQKSLKRDFVSVVDACIYFMVLSTDNKELEANMIRSFITKLNPNGVKKIERVMDNFDEENIRYIRSALKKEVTERK